MLLYVAQDKKRPGRHDLGSVLCMRLLELLPTGVVEVRAVEQERAKPAWLRGTPSLLDENGDVHTGHAALWELQRATVEHAERRGAASATKKSSAGCGGMSARRVEPRLQMREDTRPRAPQRNEESPTMDESAMEDDDGAGVMDRALWETKVVEDDGDVDDGRKITSDEIQRMTQARNAALRASDASRAPPPPPPMTDDDE